MRTLLCSAMIFWAAPFIASANEMRPLAEVATNAAAPYPQARCAGLYQATMEWAGLDGMGEEAWETADAARKRLILASALIAKAASGGTIEHRVEITVRDVRNIADLYLTRMEGNYASDGQAFGEDPVFKSDLTYCRSITEALQ